MLALLPRASAPPVFGSYAEWEAFVERFVEIGLADGYTRFWWDIRPTRASARSRCARPTSRPRSRSRRPWPRCCRRSASPSSQASRLRPPTAATTRRTAGCFRFGPRAQLIHPTGDRLVGVEELTHELLALIEPAARKLDSIESLQVLDPRTCEGDRQLEVGRERGLEAVAEEQPSGRYDRVRWRPAPRRFRSAASAASVASAALPRTPRPRRPRARQREPDGQVHAAVGRRADRPRRDPGCDGQSGLPGARSGLERVVRVGRDDRPAANARLRSSPCWIFARRWADDSILTAGASCSELRPGRPVRSYLVHGGRRRGAARRALRPPSGRARPS